MTDEDDELPFELGEVTRRDRPEWEEQTIAVLYVLHGVLEIPIPDDLHHRHGKFSETAVRLLGNLPRSLRNVILKDRPSLIAPYVLYVTRRKVASFLGGAGD